MDDTLRSKLHDLALTARRLLTDETRSVLTAVYGLSSDGHFEPVTRLPAVQAIPEVAETRRRLEQFLRDEVTAGRKGSDAVERLVRETAFTHLNRLVALKLLEARRLVRGTLDRYHASNGFFFYRADHPDDEACYQAGDMPQDARGEGPRDSAYRHFLLWQSGQLAREVPVLFDATNLPSQLFPRPRALRDLIEMLNAPELREAWARGNEETIGWVYQYFNSQELEQAFRDARLSGKKFEREDIPAVTQLFTPRWIVRFLVENTLGRHWLQMHPDSRLGEELAYLVPLAGEVSPVPLKPVRELTLLDPACGTMHFGLVAFDLFAAMYREELDRAGEPGWPAQPSVAHTDEIPAAILANNIFGIDIDLRAVQLAALSLYVRAKTLNQQTTVVPRNLVCADVNLLDDQRLEAFIATIGNPQSGVIGMLRLLWPRLKQAGELGSLLRLDEDLRPLTVAQPSGKRTSGMSLLPGMGDLETSRFTAFGNLEIQARELLNGFARQEAERGGDATLFVAGAEQGFKLLDLLGRRYDLVVANPPYMSVRKMNRRVKDFMARAYPEGKGDTYAAFIQRCLELTTEQGSVGMLTMHSFMFIGSYEELRSKLCRQATVSTMLHLGPALFHVGNPGTLQTTAFILRREARERRRQESIGTYFRLVREPDAEAKRVAFERAVEELNHSRTAAPSVFRYRQGDFDAIPGAPWVYWVTPGLRRLFVELPRLEVVAQPRQGLATADNTRFLRYWWEVGLPRVLRYATDAEVAQRSRMRWFPYMKGGAARRWWGNQEYCVNWCDGGAELRAMTPISVIRNPSFYFRRGVTYSFLTQGSFSARFSPGGFVFDVAGSSLFPPEQHTLLVLALLNSTLATYALKLLNPTVNFQVGDLARLPTPTQTSTVLDGLVERTIALTREESVESETTYDFVAPPAWPNGGAVVAMRHTELAAIEREIDEEVYRLYAIEDEDRAAIEAELVVNPRDTETQSVEDGEEPEPSHDDEPSDALSLDTSAVALARRWLSYAVGIALGRFQPGGEETIGRGRFTPDVAAHLRTLVDADGMGLIESGHPDDLGSRIERLLELMLGEGDAHQVITAATDGKSLTSYLTGDFYKQHVPMYRKRPVYWLLQSPRKTFSILLFHERLTSDSLPLLLGNRYLQGRINALRGQLGELQGKIAAAAPGRARKAAEREYDEVADRLTDAEEFARFIRTVIERPNERGEVVGWRPEIDDGVLINLAPLFTLMPAWAAEPRRCWQALERGDYDWSHTAMRYWPDRVLAKCRTNKSFALAHGVEGPS